SASNARGAHEEVFRHNPEPNPVEHDQHDRRCEVEHQILPHSLSHEACRPTSYGSALRRFQGSRCCRLSRRSLLIVRYADVLETPCMNPIAKLQPLFAEFMGMKITHLSTERIEAELPVREELSNRNGIMHGGAIMAFADNMGGTGACANLPEGASTTTIE